MGVGTGIGRAEPLGPQYPAAGLGVPSTNVVDLGAAEPHTVGVQGAITEEREAEVSGWYCSVGPSCTSQGLHPGPVTVECG